MFLWDLMQHSGIYSTSFERKKAFCDLAVYMLVYLPVFFPGSCLRQPIQNRPAALLPRTLFFKAQSSFQVVQNWQWLCSVFHGTVMHPWRLREAIFLLYIGQKALL